MSSVPDHLPVFLAVDVEPDTVALDVAAPAPFHGYEAAHRCLSEARPLLEDRTGSPVRYCWFVRMDPQIARVYGSLTWIAERYGPLLDASARAGDEIGLHPHWHRWDATLGDWRIDVTDRSWIEDGLQSALEGFVTAFGRPCRTVSFGSWVSDHLFRLADRAGIRFDLSLRPGQRRARAREVGGVSRVALPSHLGLPRHPYRPARTNFRRPGATDRLDLTLIPLTSGPVRVRPSVRGIAGRARYVLASGLRDWRPRVLLTMSVARASPNLFADLLGRVLDAGPTHLAFVDRSDFGINRLEGFRGALRVLAEHPARERLAFTTPPAAFACGS